MQDYFNDVTSYLETLLRGDEVITSSFDAEESDFVRFNRNEIRQAGRVVQREISIDLIDRGRHANGQVSLSGEMETDRGRLKRLVEDLRGMIPHLPEDPFLLYSEEVRSSEKHGEDRVPRGTDAVAQVLEAGKGKDLVGMYAAGGIYSGFANSLGQRNWFDTHSFNLDWSLYHQKDKAVKSAYAGFSWSQPELVAKIDSAAEQLGVLTRSPRTIDPGRYRVYLSPVALYDLLQTVSWGGFGLKDHRTKQTTLLKMVQEGLELHPSVSIQENTEEGVAPNFQSAGFIKPPKVDLIEGGCFRNCLVSPRSAKEYGVHTNGASLYEAPESIEMSAGGLPRAEVLQKLGHGLYINNVWYLNYSDRPACRITGMTRFATFWVENGKIVAPVNVMRFDETIYRMLGSNLIDLTAERDLILDADTYERRSTTSGRVPGALVEEFHLTL